MKQRGLSRLGAIALIAACGIEATESVVSCTVEQDDDGVTTISCPDGTNAVIENGRDGNDGKDGHSGVLDVQMLEPGHQECPAGGVAITFGVEDQPDTHETVYICNDASPGGSLLINIERFWPNEECPEGGHAVQVGFDLDGDGKLSPDEVVSSSNLCFVAGNQCLSGVRVGYLASSGDDPFSAALRGMESSDFMFMRGVTWDEVISAGVDLDLDVLVVVHRESDGALSNGQRDAIDAWTSEGGRLVWVDATLDEVVLERFGLAATAAEDFTDMAWMVSATNTATHDGKLMDGGGSMEANVQLIPAESGRFSWSIGFPEPVMDGGGKDAPPEEMEKPVEEMKKLESKDSTFLRKVAPLCLVSPDFKEACALTSPDLPVLAVGFLPESVPASEASAIFRGVMQEATCGSHLMYQSHVEEAEPVRVATP